MKYEDFPILNNNQYEELDFLYKNSNINKQITYNRIFNKLNQVINSSLTLTENVNPLLRNIITQNNIILNQILKNISANFAIKTNNTTTIKQFSLFDYMFSLNSLLEELLILSTQEEKTYYKTFLLNTQKAILNCLNNIILTLAKSNIILFKHM